MENYNDLNRIVDGREYFLESMLTQRYMVLDRQDARFILARKWNSWYPSYFQVEGGCYALISKKPIDDEEDPGVVVVDPGFKFLQILRRFGIEPFDIKNIIVSHFHPDHVGGLQEFLALAYRSDQECNIYLNPTSFNEFRNYQSRNITMHEIMPSQMIRIAEYSVNKGFESIMLRSYEAHHRETGNRYRSLSLILEILAQPMMVLRETIKLES